jgi:hypothetical protein
MMSRTASRLLLALLLGGCGGVETDWEGPAARGKADDRATTVPAEQVVYYRRTIEDETLKRTRNGEVKWGYGIPRVPSRRAVIHVMDFIIARQVRIEIGIAQNNQWIRVGLAETEWIGVGCEGKIGGSLCTSEVQEAVDALRGKKTLLAKKGIFDNYLQPVPADSAVKKWWIDTNEGKGLVIPEAKGHLRLVMGLHNNLASIDLDVIVSDDT